MKILPAIFMLIIIVSIHPVSAEPWTKSVDANITMTQYSYTDNWAGGEAGAMAWTFFSNSLAEKQINDMINNKNTLKLLFGQTHNQDKDTKKWGKPDKSNDLIDFESVFRFNLKTYVDPFAALRIESQFFDTSNSDNKRLFNPLTFTESFGISRVIIKEEKREWSARFGAGFREFINRDFLDMQTNKKETKTSNDGGLIFVNDFKTPLAEDRILLTSKLTVFQALFYSESDKIKGTPEENYWKTADIEWENIFTASITKYLMVNLYTQLLYDKEIARGGRFKQMLSLGLTYKLL
ncbi:MAG: DUF3078 domain-containing protein [Candidatus Latescibacteria bacterium]|nr:DUF3078 domain-containing protein [Candidatus Latescibacterota bacterium]